MCHCLNIKPFLRPLVYQLTIASLYILVLDPIHMNHPKSWEVFLMERVFPGLQLVGHTCAIITLCKCTLCKQGRAGNEARVTQQTNNSESLSRCLGQKSPRAPKRCVSPLKLSGSVQHHFGIVYRRISAPSTCPCNAFPFLHMLHILETQNPMKSTQSA